VKRALALLALTSAGVYGQAPPPPDCSILPGSTQQGKLRAFDTETLYEYMNGNSEGYFLYGFERMKGVTCVRGSVTYVVDLSEFKSPEAAYGMFTANLDPREPTEKIGAGGQVGARKVIFVRGNLFAEIAAEGEANNTAALREAAQAWDKKLPGGTAVPRELSWFPKQGIQPGFPRQVPQSVLGLRILKSGYLAQYDDGKAFIVTEASPADATALLAKLKERFQPSTPVDLADGGFSAEDRYLGRLCIVRKGARIIGWTNVPAGQDSSQFVKRILAQVP
jgi:hypothetical protein